MLDFIKKQKIGNWITLGTLILAVVSAIVYGVHISKVGTFYGLTVPTLVITSIISIVLLVAVLVLSQFEFGGIVGKIVSIACDVMRVVVPALLFLGLINFIASRADGLGFLYGAADNIRDSIQTPENLASAESGIAGFVLYAISAVIGIVAAFFSVGKKEEA
ncbi:MAG: hypothetical protein J1F33_07465 [Clostridiales bacterium]|nr:hypothetical protein [Clostridiales bacterium]